MDTNAAPTAQAKSLEPECNCPEVCTLDHENE